MNFTDYIKAKIRNQEPQKNIYGKTIVNYYYLKNLNFEEKTTIAELKNLNFDFNKDKNQLDVEFELLYKGYTLATDVYLELFEPFLFDFIGNTKRTSNIKTATKKLKAYYNTIFKFEISSNNLIIQAKNEDLDFQLKTHFKKVNLNIEIVNTMAFIETLEKRPKHTKLFDNICKTITDKQLITIASADYGYNKESFTVLKHIQETQILPKEISGNLIEVLSLSGYHTSENEVEHQTQLFNCTLILLGKYNEEYEPFDLENLIPNMFVSTSNLETVFIEQTQAFFLEFLSKSNRNLDVQLYMFAIAGFDLLLKKESDFKDGFHFIQNSILNELDFEHDIAYSAKIMKKATLIMLDNLDFIKNETLKKDAKILFTSIVRICEERYDLKAISALFKRTFNQETQEKAVQLMPKILNVAYNDRYKYLAAKGFNAMQTKIITRSMFNASCFLDGSDYEMELKKNIFFETYISLNKKK